MPRTSAPTADVQRARHDQIPPRAKLTTRAVGSALDALAHDDTTVSALARHLGVDWHTLGTASKQQQHRVSSPERLEGVKTIGVDEHIWRRGSYGPGRAVTGMVDLTCDEQGCLRARLLERAKTTPDADKRWRPVGGLRAR
jgi:transposase